MIFSDPTLFAFSLIITGCLLFLLAYFMITLSDLECDYLNAQQCCEQLNQWVVPKLVANTLLASFLLFHGHWIVLLLNMPMVAWMAYNLAKVPKGNMGIYDPTEIHNRQQLKKHMREVLISMGYYFITFFIYIYCMIISLLQGDPINRKEEDEVEF